MICEKVTSCTVEDFNEKVEDDLVIKVITATGRLL